VTVALSPEDVEKLLATHVVGRVGCHADGVTYVVPVTYAYDDGSVYAHSAEGQKMRMMRANPQVCFEVEEVLDLCCWKSVVAQGTFEELHGDEATRARELLLASFRRAIGSPTAVPHPSPTVPTVERVLYRIRLGERSGRAALH
jgi:nitroimidazol reductase NimA-like FMN-containing flavoprotein (pyridoxamine 5'-phosphate oxidase superfamily)